MGWLDDLEKRNGGEVDAISGADSPYWEQPIIQRQDFKATLLTDLFLGDGVRKDGTDGNYMKHGDYARYYGGYPLKGISRSKHKSQSPKNYELRYSQYKPSNSTNKSDMYIANKDSAFNAQVFQYYKENYEGKTLKPSYTANPKNASDHETYSTFGDLGNFTIGKGKDNKGEYISYYDKWNYSRNDDPDTNKTEYFGAVKPFEVYDRIYIDEKTGKPKKKNGGEVPKAEDGVLTPQQKLQAYYKSQAQKGGDAVRKGREKFAKDYLIPTAKVAGAFTPAGPVIGLTDAYNAYQEGNTTGAIMGAGLEALPYGLKYAKNLLKAPNQYFKLNEVFNKVTKNIKNLPENLPGDGLEYSVKKNIDWINSEEYIKRRSATTGETAEQIKTWVSNKNNSFSKSNISIGNSVMIPKNSKGVFRPSVGNIIQNNIHVKNTGMSDMLGTIDHETGHALSPLGELKDYYKNYPTIPIEGASNKGKIKKALSKFSNSDEAYADYLSEPEEQQVRFNKWNKKIRKDLNTKDDILTEDQLNTWSYNHYSELDKPYYQDVKSLIDNAKKGTTKTDFLNTLNKAWGIVPTGIGINKVVQNNNEKRNGGEIPMAEDGLFVAKKDATNVDYTPINWNVMNRQREKEAMDIQQEYIRMQNDQPKENDPWWKQKVSGVNFTPEQRNYDLQRQAENIVEYKNTPWDEKAKDIAIEVGLALAPELAGIKITKNALKSGKDFIKFADNNFIPESKLFRQTENSLTRGIGTNKVGLEDLQKSGIVRGNPRGRLLSPKNFASEAKRPAMKNFKELYPNTYENIASNNLSEKEYELVSDYFSKNPIYPKSIKKDDGKYLLQKESILDDFKNNYPTYENYVNQESSKNYLDAYSDGTPMAFWYENGQFPNYSNYPSKYFLKLNEADKYGIHTPTAHLHPTTKEPISILDNNLEAFETIKNWRGKKIGKQISKEVTKKENGGEINNWLNKYTHER